MAEKKNSDKPKSSKLGKKSDAKKTETVRQRRESASKAKPTRIRSSAGRVKSGVSKARKTGKREYHLPLPDNKFGSILGKKINIIPKFVSSAFEEVSKVTWPDRKQTVRLTIAVLIFAVILSSFVGALDYVFGEIFERLFVNTE